MSGYKDTLYENSEKMGDQIQLFISNEGIMRVFFNDAESNIYTIVNKNSNYRQIIDNSYIYREEGYEINSKQRFNSPSYGGYSENITIGDSTLFRSPYKIYKYENEKGKALVFDFQERYYIRPSISTPIYNTRGYNESNSLPRLNSYINSSFQNFNILNERFWKQYYDGIVYYDVNDGFNTNEEIFLRELTVGSIDTYDIVNSEFDLTNTQSSSPSPIIVAPYKRLILGDEKSKYMKTARPPKIYLDSNNRTGNNEEYYKGIFVLYPCGKHIYLSRLNEIGTSINPSGEKKKVILNELIGRGENLNIDKFHCDLTLDILQDNEDNEFNGIWSIPYFVYSSLDPTYPFLAWGYAPYNLSDSTLDSEIKQILLVEDTIGKTYEKCRILTFHLLDDNKTYVLISAVVKTSGEIPEKLTLFFTSKPIIFDLSNSIASQGKKSISEPTLGFFQTFEVTSGDGALIVDYDIVMDNQNNIYVCYSERVPGRRFTTPDGRTVDGDALNIYLVKINFNLDLDTKTSTVIERFLLYEENEYLDYFKTISMKVDLDQKIHIAYKVVDSVYKIKYWTNSDKTPKKIEKNEENDNFKLLTYGQTLNMTRWCH